MVTEKAPTHAINRLSPHTYRRRTQACGWGRMPSVLACVRCFI
nr:MAG TPA: hypothetical protein [Caudoviricetes sp.]